MSGKVTALRLQIKRRDRVNLFLDDEYAFSLQAILAAELHLGQELTDEDIAALKRRDQVERGYERALSYLSYRPRSEQEMRRYLEGKEIEAEAMDTIIARLRRARLLSDVAFAQFWVENRGTFRPRGARALRAELRQKGVTREVIDEALVDVDEEKNAMLAAERALRRFSGLDEQTFRQRMLGFLQRRGFGYAVSRRVSDHFWQELHGSPDRDRD